MTVTEKEKVVVYLDAQDATRLREMAIHGERSVTGLVRLAVKAYLAALDTKEART